MIALQKVSVTMYMANCEHLLFQLFKIIVHLNLW